MKKAFLSLGVLLLMASLVSCGGNSTTTDDSGTDSGTDDGSDTETGGSTTDKPGSDNGSGESGGSG
jgi:predicted small lipoprotein YifL